MILEDPIRENVSLANLPAFARLGLVSTGAEREAAERQREALRIKAPDVEVRTGALSGGNQQKVVLGKWLSMAPKVMIFDEPTRGIDVGSKAEIYGLMRALAEITPPRTPAGRPRLGRCQSWARDRAGRHDADRRSSHAAAPLRHPRA